MAFFYTRPTRLHLSQECQKIAKSMRRQPLHKNGKISFKEHKKKEEEAMAAVVEKENVAIKDEHKTLNESSSDEKGSSNDSKESIDTLDGASKETRVDKLSKIVKKLSERIASKLALNGANGHHHHASTAVIPTSYSLVSHIANSINSQSPHQHVSPRKRILRELEKVTLEDTKRSRPKSVTTNGTSNITHPPQSSNVTANGSLTKNNENKAPQPPASSSSSSSSSRPISSYSITSLLAHNTSSSSTSSSNSSSNTPHNDSLTTSLHHQSYGRLQHSPPKSPGQKRKSPHMQSPIQSPSPEHHAFHKYRPMTTTPTSQAQMPPASSSSPYNSSYHSPSYMRGSPSPSDALNSRLRTNYQHSPSHHYGGTSSPSSNYNARDSSLSPNVVEKNNSSRSTPTPQAVRTVPKKTAALRQQFSSPTMNEKKASPPVKNEVKPMDVDSLLRPSALIPPPMPPAAALSQMTHPAALSHYPYMYSPLSYLPPPAVPPYYHPFYNPAIMAAAAAYRFPMPGYPGTAATTLSQLAPQQQHQQSPQIPPVSYADTKSTANGQQRNLASPPSIHHSAYSSPWNPIPITNHSINDDGHHIPKVKDEPLISSGKVLCLQFH